MKWLMETMGSEKWLGKWTIKKKGENWPTMKEMAIKISRSTTYSKIYILEDKALHRAWEQGLLSQIDLDPAQR